MQVVGWFTYWKPSRLFAMDMAGFAVNLQLIFDHPDAGFSNSVPRGYQESTLLSGLKVTLDDLEPMANLCTEVYFQSEWINTSQLTFEKCYIHVLKC